MPRVARIGAGWLFGMALFILGLAVYGVVSSRWACDAELSGYRFICDVAWLVAAVVASGAVVHAMAAVSIWRGRLRGALAGFVIALVALPLCTAFLEDERWWLVPPVAAGYLATLLVLAYALVQGRPRVG